MRGTLNQYDHELNSRLCSTDRTGHNWENSNNSRISNELFLLEKNERAVTGIV